MRTPPLDAGLLAGITRAFVFELGAAMGVTVEEAALKDEDLFDADEAFFTSTTKELMPIVQVDDRRSAPARRGRSRRSCWRNSGVRRTKLTAATLRQSPDGVTDVR